MIILKPTIAFILLLILTRILGKKQMSQMTFFNYVTGITIGSLAAELLPLMMKQFGTKLSA